MKTCSTFLSFLFILMLLSSNALALPIINAPGDGVEDVAGTPYAYYQNSGQWMFTAEGNNSGNAANLALAQTKVIDWLNINTTYDTTGFALTETTSGITVTGVDENGFAINDLGAAASGTYEVNTNVYPGGIEFYALKAATWYAFYFEAGSQTYGSWSTYDLWLEKGRGEILEISHWTGYNAMSVPEPATFVLVGIGLFGLVGIGRRRIK